MSGGFQSGMAAINAAKERAAQANNNGDWGFFKLANGETKTVRFLTGIDEMVVYKHDCGLNNWEMSRSAQVEMTMAGTPVICPQCQQPLTDADVVGIRPGIINAPLHEQVVCPSDGKQRSFVCISQNPKYQNPDGSPMYQCPICSVTKSDGSGKPAYPIRLKLYGAALIRTVQSEMKLMNGVSVPQITGISDATREVTDKESGETKVVPDIVMVGQGLKNFWAYLVSVHEHEGSISYYDFNITRIGERLETSYQMDKVSSEPNPLDWSIYQQFLPDIGDFLSYQGSPEFYAKHGHVVPGFVPQPKEGQAQQAQPAQTGYAQPQVQAQPYAAQGAVAPVQPQAQPAQQYAPPVTQQAQPVAPVQPQAQPVVGQGQTQFDAVSAAIQQGNAADLTSYNPQ